MIHLVVTGDSLSAGTEMMDAEVFPNYNLLLDQFKDKELNQQRIYRWRLQAQWGMKHFKQGARRRSLDDGKFIRAVVACYVRQEKKLSWPAMLPELVAHRKIKITNLAQKGSSFKRSCRQFERFIRYNKPSGEIVAIHQMPNHRRTYFKQAGEVLRVVDPYHLASLDHVKDPRQEEVMMRTMALDRYRAVEERDRRNNYFIRALERHIRIMERLARANNIKNYYICEEAAQAQLIDPRRIIFPNFKSTRQSVAYARGLTGNIIAPAYNEMVCRGVIEKLFS